MTDGGSGADGGTSADGGTIFDGGTGLDGGAGADGGIDGGVTAVVFPTSAGWTFYGPQNGGPSSVYGVTADGNGNIWVAGGEEGLFVLKPGASSMQRFTMADGLHPYGYMDDGSDAPGPHYLKVISVSGGPGNTVFVGYQGRPPPDGALSCEDNWDGPHPDPSIYKSGDADKVTLNGNTLSVVHYDIFSGPGVVGGEQRGREKLCNILRIAYDPTTSSVWFGGNHGFARGDANFAGNPKCNGQIACAGVLEHVHPAINGCSDEACSQTWLLTDAYYGIAPDPSGDVWFGGAIRSTKFKFATNNRDYFAAESQTEDAPYAYNRIDVWPDKVAEPNEPTPSQRVDDEVSGMAVASDGSIWVSSFIRGLAHLSSGGAVLGYVTSGLITPQISSLHADPKDGSIWVGESWGGVTRMQGGTMTQYSSATFGNDLIQGAVTDIQHAGSGANRRILVAFAGGSGKAGAIGVYSGN